MFVQDGRTLRQWAAYRGHHDLVALFDKHKYTLVSTAIFTIHTSRLSSTSHFTSLIDFTLHVSHRLQTSRLSSTSHFTSLIDFRFHVSHR